MHQQSVPKYTFVEFCLWLLGQRKRMRVQEDSMLPTLKAGDEVFVDLSAYKTKPPLVGEVVLAQHPEKKGVKIFKRVTAVSPQNSVFLMGDNPLKGTDSRHFGEVPLELIYGRVSSLFI